MPCACILCSNSLLYVCQYCRGTLSLRNILQSSVPPTVLRSAQRAQDAIEYLSDNVPTVQPAKACPSVANGEASARNTDMRPSSARETPILTACTHGGLLFPTPIIIFFTSPSFLADIYRSCCARNGQPPATTGFRQPPPLWSSIARTIGL
jgi:hypothetical protein